MPCISVIIPTYNRAPVFERAVHSVLEQTRTDLEVILVDDGSDDDTRKRSATLCKDPRLRIFEQENKGVSAARNLGIRHARGKYIALLDSDDYWLPRKLQRQLDFMREGGFHISQTDEMWMRRGRRVNPKYKHAKFAGWFFECSLALCLISPSCVMFTRHYWETVGPFDESLPACEDYDLWLRTGPAFPVGLLPEPLVVKTGGNPDQLSGKIIGLDLYRIYAMGHLLERDVLDSHASQLTADMLQRKALLYIQGCLKRGREIEALRIRDMVRQWLDCEVVGYSGDLRNL